MGEIMNYNFENEKAQSSFTAKKNNETFLKYKSQLQLKCALNQSGIHSARAYP